MEPICLALHPHFKNASQKARSPTRAMALTAHMHRSTLSNPMLSWTYQAPHLLVIGCDFAKHVHIKTHFCSKPHAGMHLHFIADKFVVQNHGLAIIIAQFLSLRPTSPQRAMRTEPPPGYSSTARSQADNHNGASALGLKVHQKDKHAHTTQRCDQTTWIQKTTPGNSLS